MSVRPVLSVCAALAVALPASAAPKKETRQAPAKGPQLAVTTTMLFSLPPAPGKERTSRWTPKKGYPVQGASVQIDNRPAVTTAAWTGIAKLDLTGLAPGKHTLTIIPPKDKDSKGEAGPNLFKGQGSKKLPDHAWRRATFEIVTDAKGLKSARPAQTRSGIVEHASVFEVKPASLVIDWRPDWAKAKSAESRNGKTVDMVVIHQTGPGGLQGALNTLTNTSVSAHYLVDEDGFVVKLVADGERSHHAEGVWMGSSSQWASLFSIGIEVVHSDKGKRSAFPKPQMDAIVKLVKDLRTAFPKITRQRVIGHADLEMDNENRAEDPGWMFDWPRLERAGLSRKRAASQAQQAGYFGLKAGETIKYGASAKPDPRIKHLQVALKKIGWVIKDQPGVFGAYTNRALRRFIIRYRSPNPTLQTTVVTVDQQLAKDVFEVAADDK